MKNNKETKQKKIINELQSMIRSIIDLENQMSDIWKQDSTEVADVMDFVLEGMQKRIEDTKFRLGAAIVKAVRHGILEISLDDFRQEVYKGYQKDESVYIAAES